MTDHHSTVMSITSRLTVHVHHIPENIDWNDTTSQRSVQSLTIDDFIASKADCEDFKERAIQYTARYLVKEFKSLGHLKKFTGATSDTSGHQVRICSYESSVQG